MNAEPDRVRKTREGKPRGKKGHRNENGMRKPR